MLRDPSRLELPPRERALAGLASVLAEAPWTVDDEDLDRLRAAGLPDEAIVQAVSVVAQFSHFTRTADATGISPDYDTALPRLEVDVDREPLPRPDRSEWPTVAPRLSRELRPEWAASVARWRAYVFTPTGALSAQDRAVLARAAARSLCDAAGEAEHADGAPSSPRGAALAAFAEKLTVTPWRMREADLGALRREGLDERALLHAVAVVGFQNAASRVRLALG